MNKLTKILIVVIILLLILVGYLIIEVSSSTNGASTIVYVNDIGALGAGGTLDHACSVWCGRIYSFASLMLGFAIVYGFYSYKIALIDAQVALVEIENEAKIKQTQTLTMPQEKEEVRLIPFNTRQSTNKGEDIRLTENLVLPKKQLITFVTKSLQDNGPGLAIGRWKKEGWDQTVVEQLLDYMHSIGLVTERANGRVCTYTQNYEPAEVLRRISIVR